MIYELGLCEERNTFSCCWDNVIGLFQKKSIQGRLIELNPGVNHQKRSVISRGD